MHGAMPILWASREGAMVTSGSAWESALSQLDEAARKMNLDPGVLEVLRNRRRSLEDWIRVRMADGCFSVFMGFRVEHTCWSGRS
jgi:glutamate dehydrogenase/leucine dehydrogenase